MPILTAVRESSLAPMMFQIYRYVPVNYPRIITCTYDVSNLPICTRELLPKAEVWVKVRGQGGGLINVERAPDRSYRKKVKGSEVLMQRRFSRIV